MKVAVMLLSVLAASHLIVAGCAPVPVPYDPPGNSARLEVNDGLRAACGSLTDPEIAATLAVVEAERLGGFAYPEAVPAALSACEDRQNALECTACFIACVNQVYGQ